MSPTLWTDDDSQRAREIWAEYQSQHDVSALIGQAAGIDPSSGRVWFGESAADIWRRRKAEAIEAPIYCVRVGFDHYLRKGGRR